MGGACSKKRDHGVSEDSARRGFSARYSKSGSSKWLGNSLPRSVADSEQGRGKYPSLMELCIHKICKDIGAYSSFDMLPRDLTQQIFDELVSSQCLTDASLEAFRDCALQDVYLGDYPGVKDDWMDIISSQGPSLLSLDISGSDVTDSALILLQDCPNLQSLTFNYCDQISNRGLNQINGLTNLTSLSFKKSIAITAQGMSAFANLVNLVNLDLERCSGIHGGLIHLKDLVKLESLNVRCCNCITDADMKPLSGLTNLKELQISCSKVTDSGVAYLKGLRKLVLLNMEGCPVTAASLEFLSDLAALSYLNLNRCGLSDNGCETLAGLKKLKILNLGFNNITDACLVHLKGLTNLESLNLDSCKIGDEGLAHLAGLVRMKCLELSDTEVGSSGVRHLSGQMLMDDHPTLFWTPCAAHCIDLMLHDICKLPIITTTVKRAIALNGYIYNHPYVLNMMRTFTEQKELIRPGVTRFATVFLTLQSIYNQKNKLRRMFTSEEWSTSRYHRDTKGKDAYETVLSPGFWNNILYSLRATGPLVRVLRMVDSEKKPAMGYIYEAMDRAKEAISKSFNYNEAKYYEIWEIIDKRWNDQLHRPLHAAGYYLNPEYFYTTPRIESNEELNDGFLKTMARLVPDEGIQHLVETELSLYRYAQGVMGSPNAIRNRALWSPGLSNLESINFSFTLVTDGGLRKLSALTSLKSLNLDARQITDAGLAALTSLTGLTHLDLFGARITDYGTNCFRYFKNLRSLEVCSGLITDAGVKNIKDLYSLTLLNLSQNSALTDKTLELLSGLTSLVSLNVSNSRVTNGGLLHLRPLKNLRCLTLESCKVTAAEMRKLHMTVLPNLVTFRPE